MRVKFFAVALLPWISGAASVQADALAFLDTLGESETITDADLKASTQVVVDLDCLGTLITECAAGNESSCDKVDKTEPLPCLVQTKADTDLNKPIELADIDSEHCTHGNHLARVTLVPSTHPGVTPAKIIDSWPIMNKAECRPNPPCKSLEQKLKERLMGIQQHTRANPSSPCASKVGMTPPNRALKVARPTCSMVRGAVKPCITRPSPGVVKAIS